MNRHIRSMNLSGFLSSLAVFFVVLALGAWTPAPAEARGEYPSTKKVPTGVQAASSTAAVQPGPKLRHLVLNFQDIPCVGHVRSILDAMGAIKGTSKHKVVFEDNRGEMDYDPSVVSPDAIVKGMPWDCPARVTEDKAIP